VVVASIAARTALGHIDRVPIWAVAGGIDRPVMTYAIWPCRILVANIQAKLSKRDAVDGPPE
jgi:hypothetical protein